jgi:hypothetical protein
MPQRKRFPAYHDFQSSLDAGKSWPKKNAKFGRFSAARRWRARKWALRG